MTKHNPLYFTVTVKANPRNQAVPVSCPQCKFTQLRIHVEEKWIRIQCTKCYFQHTYLRIEKNDI